MKDRKIATTKRILTEMLKENTGRALLDSGDFYGRNWQRNQDRNFDQEPAAVLRFGVWRENNLEISMTHNVYHWLLERLTYDAKINRRFQRWAKRHDPDDRRDWLELMETFTHENSDGLIESLGGCNTYNGEDMLSQVLQYELFNYDGDPYVLLQIHGGCDVRGGYTTPRVFKIAGFDEYALYDNAFGTISCSHCGEYWHTDDSYHWYHEGACGYGAGKQLETYPAIEEDSEDGWICAWRLDHGDPLDFEHLHNTYNYPERFVFVRDNGHAVCPLCGVGELEGH